MAVLYALVLPGMLLFCGLVLDLGVLEFNKMRMQSAADAAAIGAELETERNTGNATAVAQGIASMNGFTDDSGATTSVTLTSSPTTQGDFSGRYDTLQVTITKKLQTAFMAATTQGTVTVTASAIAQLPPCVYLLGTRSMAAYALNESPNNGFATNMFSDCPVSVNGKMYSGSNNFLSVPETLISASSGTSTLGGTIKSGVVYSGTTVTDPLASLTQPAFSGGCTYTGYSYTASGGSVTLQPGNYCKGMTLGNSSNDGCGTCITTVTLNPGLYIVTGGANWQHVAMTGTGVTLFFTTGGGASYGQINIGNSSVINLSAPTSGSSGSIAGILFFLDRNWTNTSAQDFNFNSSGFGTSTPGSDGIWYLPSTGLQMYNAAWTCNNYCSLVADNFTSSNVTLVPSDNYSSISGGNPFRTLAVLVQ